MQFFGFFLTLHRIWVWSWQTIAQGARGTRRLRLRNAHDLATTTPLFCDLYFTPLYTHSENRVCSLVLFSFFHNLEIQLIFYLEIFPRSHTKFVWLITISYFFFFLVLNFDLVFHNGLRWRNYSKTWWIS